MDDDAHLAAALAGLQVAQRKLYEVFAPVPRPERVVGCSHCVSPEEEQRLLNGPVASLEATVLDRYASKALSTWGEPEDFRYFVPRLLECVAAAEPEFPDSEIVLSKLAAAEWSTWPDEEIVAVDDFLRAWWQATLHRYPSSPRIDTVLCSLAATGSDLRVYLRLWSRLETKASIEQLHELVTTGVDWSSPPRLSNAFWDHDSPAHSAVLNWLIRGRVRDWLSGDNASGGVKAAFARETREPVLELLADLAPWLIAPKPPLPPRILVGAEASAFMRKVDSYWERVRALNYARARVEARARGKEPFNLQVLETMCDTSHEGRERSVEARQSEYEEMYYTSYRDVLTLAEFAEKVNELNRWS